MNYTKTIRIVVGVVLAALAGGHVQAAETLPILKAGPQTFTNVVVVDVSDTQLFFKYAGGMSSVRLKDLEPTLQKTYGYDAAKEAAIESAPPVSVVTPVSDTPVETRKTSVPDGMVSRDFRLEDGRRLRLCFPKVWTAPDDGSSSLLKFQHPYEEGFSVLVSVMPKKNVFANMETQDALAVPGNQELRYSLEKSLTLEPINGTEAKGHYFVLTRKSPGQKQTPCESQGLVRFGNLLVYFCIECKDWKGKEPQYALEMIQTAQLVAKP